VVKAYLAAAAAALIFAEAQLLLLHLSKSQKNIFNFFWFFGVFNFKQN
jgi:hypothetical protein